MIETEVPSHPSRKTKKKQALSTALRDNLLRRKQRGKEVDAVSDASAKSYASKAEGLGAEGV